MFFVNHLSSNRDTFENFTYYHLNYNINLQMPLWWKLN